MKEQENKLISRQEVPVKYQWNVKKIFATDGDWEAAFNECLAMLPEAKKFQGHLADNVLTFLSCLQYQDALGMALDKIYLYASLKKDEDNTNGKYQSMYQKVQGLGVEASAALSFVQPEVLALPDHLLSQYLQNTEVAVYTKYISEMIRMKAHTLSAAEEQIIAMAGEMAAAPSDIFKMLNNADITFPTVESDHGLCELTHGNYTTLMESSNRQVRKGAFQALYSTYDKQRNTLAALLSANVKSDVFGTRVRKFDSTLAGELYADNIPVNVYDQLIKSVRSRFPVFYDYLQLRKKILGVDELHMYDVYAPLVAEPQKQIAYEEAVATVMKALAPLGEEYLQILAQGLKDGWVDVCENKGKTSGAYSSGAYGTMPYVLLNYQGNLNGVFTIAHELGHSMHSYFSWAKQPYINCYYKIFVAEVASTVNETLLVNYLLKNAQTKEEKMALINYYLEQFRTTVFRQTMFGEFEKIIHYQAESGQTLTADSLCATYYQLNQDYFGTDMVIDQEIEMEWARIPHFYRSFYVYKYATGFCAAQALAKGLLSGGNEAKRRYLEFLAGGSSEDPIELLRHAGVDMESSQPVNAAFDIFAAMLEEMKSLVE